MIYEPIWKLVLQKPGVVKVPLTDQCWSRSALTCRKVMEYFCVLHHDRKFVMFSSPYNNSNISVKKHWFSPICCSLNCFQHLPHKHILLDRGEADLLMLWSKGNTTSWLGGVNKLGNVAVHLLIISAPVHWLSRKCMGLDVGYATILLNINICFESCWDKNW